MFDNFFILKYIYCYL